MKQLGLLIILIFASICAISQVAIEGTIIGEGNEPLFGSNIYIPELEAGTSTNESGYFRIPNIPNGSFTIRVSYIGYESFIQKFTVQDTSLSMQINLEASAFRSAEVVISGGKPSSQHENAIKIETITIAELNKTGSSTLIKSLTSVPGIDAISKGEGVITPVIRGLSTSNILVLSNGIRMENYQFSENHPYLLDESAIDQVEIIKGPASLLYGSDAIGGVLNFIPEKNAQIGSTVGSAGIKYFSATNGISANLGVKGATSNWVWGIRGSAKSHMDYLQGNGEYVPNSRFNQANGRVFTGYNSKKGIFNLSYRYSKMEAGMTVLPAIENINQRGRWNDLWYQNLDYHLVTSRNTLFLNKTKLGLNFAYQNNHRRLFGLPEDEEFKKVDARLQTLNYEAKASITTSEISNFVISVQGMSQNNKNGDAPEHVLPNYNLNDISISGLVQHDFLNGIHLQAGLRFDNRFMNIPEQERHGHDHGEEEHDEGHEEEEEEIMEELIRYYGNISGSLGATYDITHNLLIRANFASAYRTPNVAELTQDGQHGVRYEQGNRDLGSQRNFEADLSIHFHTERLFLDISGYYNLINSYIFLSPTNDTTDDGDKIYKYTQDNASIAGLEGTIEILAANWLKFHGNYQYIRGLQSDGSNLPFIPQNKLNLGVKLFNNKLWEVLNPYFTTDFTFAFAQNNPAPFETNSNDYSLVSLGAGINIPVKNQKITLEIEVSNLSNTEYIDHLSTLKSLGYLNTGRNVMVYLKVPFGS